MRVNVPLFEEFDAINQGIDENSDERMNPVAARKPVPGHDWRKAQEAAEGDHSEALGRLLGTIASLHQTHGAAGKAIQDHLKPHLDLLDQADLNRSESFYGPVAPLFKKTFGGMQPVTK